MKESLEAPATALEPLSLAEAAALADTLEAANLTRRGLMRTALAEARSALGDDVPSAVVVRGPWPVGVVGLVAGRLADELGRPAVVGADLGDIVRASCRSDGSLDLADALFDAGYTLHIDAAVENLRDSPNEVAVPLTSTGADQPVKGRRYVARFTYGR